MASGSADDDAEPSYSDPNVSYYSLGLRAPPDGKLFKGVRASEKAKADKAAEEAAAARAAEEAEIEAELHDHDSHSAGEIAINVISVLLGVGALWYASYGAANPALQWIYGSGIGLVGKAGVAGALYTSPNCCSALSKLGLAAMPQSVEWESFRSSLWSQQAASLQPGCVVAPRSKGDLAKAVVVLGAGEKVYGNGKCDFSIKSGGHTPLNNANSIEGGVAIDMTHFNHTRLADDRETVHLGPGAIWNDVYEYLGAHGLATVGGRVSSVGVGGLTLGGGISFFSPRYGFVANGVVNFEVVLSNGTVVNANAASHTDLWQALKGGSGNFGIVTDIQSKTFAQSDFWGGSIFTDVDTRTKHFKAFEKLTSSKSYDPYAAIIQSMTVTNEHKAWVVGNNLQYTKSGPAANEPAAFRDFLAVPGQLLNSLRNSSLADKAKELAMYSPKGFQQLMASSTFRVDAKMMERVFQIANTTIHPLVDSTPGLVFALVFQPIPTVITEKAAASGGDSLGLEGSGNLVNVLLSVTWSKSDDNAAMYAASQTILDQANAAAEAGGVLHEYQYLNYAAPWQAPIRGYGAASNARLRTVSLEYDAEQVFQRQRKGGYRLDAVQGGKRR